MLLPTIQVARKVQALVFNLDSVQLVVQTNAVPTHVSSSETCWV